MDLRETTGRGTARHPWETERAAFFSGIVTGTARAEGPVHVLDIGSGDTYLAEHLIARLPDGSRLVCVDANYADSHLARRVIGPDSTLCTVRVAPEGQYDWILLLDVLEHVEDDTALVREQLCRLPAHGRVLVSVPAWQALYTEHDVRLGHRRRYAPSELRGLLEASGLRVMLLGGLFASLLPLRSLSKTVEVLRGYQAVPQSSPPPGRVRTATATWSLGALPTRLVARVLSLDAALCLAAARRSVPLPGLSAWALAERS
jgi:SAM-dependent methyltransferase